MSNQQQPDAYTVAEAAAKLKKSEKTIRRYIHHRYFAATKPRGSASWLINAESFREYVLRGFNTYVRDAAD